jgi:ATP-binding cassette subfamily B multidrug efflux pump
MLIALVRQYLHPYRRELWLVVVFQFISTMANLYLPGLSADIIDNGVVTGDTSYIVKIGAIMLGVTLVQILCAIVAVYYGARTAMALGRDLRGAVFGKVETFAAREVAQFGAPTLITRSTNDVQQVQMLAFLTFTFMIAAPIMCVGGIIMALRQDVALSTLIVVVVPALAVSIGVIVVRMRPLFRLMQQRIDTINRILREQIMGIRVIRAFVKEGYERERFAVANRDNMDAAIRVGRLIALIFPIVMLVMNVSVVAATWFGGYLVGNGDLQVGTLTAFQSYLIQILMSVMMATFMFMLFPRAEVSAERITEVLDTQPSVLPPAEVQRRVIQSGEVRIDNASFAYPGAEEPVLCDIDLLASPGETTAIIGSTGSGKSTLLNLIPRLFDATAGAVRLDGIDVRDMQPDDVWAAIGLIPQRPYLFTGTIASNLRFGNPDATDEALWDALEVAQARDFVEAMPERLDAPVSQGGTNLSGGQRQRVAIARALVKRPRIYLFDDSLSALDYATDAALRAAMRPVTREATVVIVAQRVSTIRYAERIVVLDEGRVVGTGTHDDLMLTCPTYREIVLSQLTEEEAA